MKKLRLAAAFSVWSVVFLAGCGGASGNGTAESAPAPSAAPVAAPPTASAAPGQALPAPSAAPAAASTDVSVTPSDGAKEVKPDAVVTITAKGGTLSEVRVEDSDGHELAGASTPDDAAWHSTAPVRVGSKYLVRAWAVGPDGNETEKQSSFATKNVRHSGTLEVAAIQPQNGSTVGVAQPLVVAFQAPVSNRKLVQEALQVTTTPHVDGAWYWIDESHIHFRPQNFWPAGTKVRLDAELARISAGKGVIGGKNRTSSFTVGRAQVIRADTRAHKVTVERAGRKIKSFDASTGKSGWETRDGTEVMMDRITNKHWTNVAIGAKKHFSLYSKYAIRITNSGEFVHDAPWATGSLGDSNTSHGCIGLRSGAMKWIWDNSLLGDPVIVTGTSRHSQDSTNTYDDWNLPWGTWSKGNS